MEHTKGWLIFYIILDLFLSAFLIGVGVVFMIAKDQLIFGLFYIMFGSSYLLDFIKNLILFRHKQYIDLAIEVKRLQQEIEEKRKKLIEKYEHEKERLVQIKGKQPTSTGLGEGSK